MITLPYLPWKDGVAPIIEVELKHGEASASSSFDDFEGFIVVITG